MNQNEVVVLATAHRSKSKVHEKIPVRLSPLYPRIKRNQDMRRLPLNMVVSKPARRRGTSELEYDYQDLVLPTDSINKSLGSVSDIMNQETRTIFSKIIVPIERDIKSQRITNDSKDPSFSVRKILTDHDLMSDVSNQLDVKKLLNTDKSTLERSNYSVEDPLYDLKKAKLQNLEMRHVVKGIQTQNEVKTFRDNWTQYEIMESPEQRVPISKDYFRNIMQERQFISKNILELAETATDDDSSESLDFEIDPLLEINENDDDYTSLNEEENTSINGLKSTCQYDWQQGFKECTKRAFQNSKPFLFKPKFASQALDEPDFDEEETSEF